MVERIVEAPLRPLACVHGTTRTHLLCAPISAGGGVVLISALLVLSTIRLVNSITAEIPGRILEVILEALRFKFEP